MLDLRRRTAARPGWATLLLAVAAAACSTQAPSDPGSPSASAPTAASTTGVVGPTVSPGPTGTAAVVQDWLVHWVRGFVTLGQEVDRFREAVRQHDQQAVANNAQPIVGGAAQVRAALMVSRPFPEPAAAVAGRMLETLADLQEHARAVTKACPGDACLQTAQEMYDITDTTLDGFRTIFQVAGVPLPEPS